MSKSKDTETKEIEGGLNCPKCGELMKRYEHGENWKPQPERKFYAYWDRCVPCKHFQNYQTAKVST